MPMRSASQAFLPVFKYTKGICNLNDLYLYALPPGFCATGSLASCKSLSSNTKSGQLWIGILSMTPGYYIINLFTCLLFEFHTRTHIPQMWRHIIFWQRCLLLFVFFLLFPQFFEQWLEHTQQLLVD